jgi:oxygen-independent coproporphyrinogen-3 oxidase
MLAGEAVTGFTETLSADVRAGEIAAFRIRMAEGIPAEEIGQWSGAMAEFEKLGLVTRSEGIVRLTRRGKLLADSVAEAFVSTP